MSDEDKSVIAAAAADTTVIDVPTKAVDVAVAELDAVGLVGQVQEEEEEDEYLNAYEALERTAATVELGDRIKDYHLLLLNPRYDEQAIKIKEQSIYR